MKNLYLILLAFTLVLSCGHYKKTGTCGSVVTKDEMNSNDSTSKVTDVADNVEQIKEEVNNTKINWLDFETAIDKNSKHKKFIFIDIYTDWCGWCKKMDATTFLDKEVVSYMNTYFYAVKMNAESKDPIAYKGVLYEYKQYNERAGYNTLAVSLLNSKMSFPSFVVLNKNEVKKGNIIGYKDAKTLLGLLKGYVGK